MTDESDWTVTELLELDEGEAREQLTVDEYEQWEQLQDLETRAEETEDEWEREEELVEDVVVHADIEQLGTRTELYGNDVLVHIDPDDREFRALLDTLESEYDDLDSVDSATVEDEDMKEDLYGLIADLYDAILVEWNGTTWGSLDEDHRDAILDDCREAWGGVAFVLGFVKCAREWRADQDEVMDAVESFR